MSGGSSAAGKEGFCDAKEVEEIGAGDEVLAVLGGLGGVDAQDEVLLEAEGGGEVGDMLRGSVPHIDIFYS